MKLKLPIGLQNLREMRTQGYVYVDKTAHVARLAEEGKYYFLARPRRFGKSLLVDTLAEAFAGSRELFEGLYLETHWDWSRKYPVLRFDFGEGVLTDRALLDATLQDQMRLNHQRHGLAWQEAPIHITLARLVRNLSEAAGQPVVLLIDEYDKPILDNLSEPERARAMREGLRNFYSVIKSLDPHLKFVLLTGVSKFSKVSLFSGLNNLEDLTLDPRAATLCGYTHAELVGAFAEYLDGVDLAEMQRWYNGYNFLGEPVYNPFDILLYLRHREFKPYWFETGTPTFLIELLRQRQFVIAEADDYWASEDLLGAFEVEAIEPEALLFQTGYATVRERQVRPNGFRYRLGFPNHEVRVSLPQAVLRRYVPSRREQQRAEDRLFQALEQDDPAALRPALHAFFASIPHNWYRRNNLAGYEGYWASLVYCLFAALGVETRAEEASHQGQVDLVIEYQGRVWLLEFKLAEDDGGQRALDQIKTKGYHLRYAGQPVTLIGMDFSREQRNLVGFAWERG
ncbi:ATP-binding protein [Candidatus Contendibacter odensensis]|uniref:AAA-ATPase n=1 Tax=Candidatus Contendobacter odensis Run_B_J11 TaxID=1400861 RepID=A0A7U7G9I7_9GAMM|nr:ATP-binding protein [Candidatus Contendobacter odensis]CDH44209.1 AAA-ATPase [Candidatus Contendobacter odensis Run_B_J11]